MWLARTVSTTPQKKNIQNLNLTEVNKTLLLNLEKRIEPSNDGSRVWYYWDHRMVPPLFLQPNVLPISPEMRNEEIPMPKISGATLDRVCFVLQGELKDWGLVLDKVLSHHLFSECVVLISLDREAHLTSEVSDGNPFYYFEKLIIDCMKCESCPSPKVEVSHFPLVYEELTQDVFILPATSETFPVHSDLIDVHGAVITDKLERSTKSQLKCLVHSFASLITALDIAPDCYVLGSTSHLIAEELNTIEIKKSSNPTPVSIVFIDRTMDMVGPTMYTTDNLMDEIYQNISKKNNSLTDEEIKNIFKSKFGPTVPVSTNTIIPRIFNLNPYLEDIDLHQFLPNPNSNSSLFNTFVLQQRKYALNEIRKKLIEIGTQIESEENNIQLNLSPKLSTDALLFKIIQNPELGHQVCIHREDILMAASQIYIQQMNAKADKTKRHLISLTKLIVSSLEEETNPIKQLLEHIKEPIVRASDSASSLPTNHIMELAILCYSAQKPTEDFKKKSKDELAALKDCLVHYLMNFPIEQGAEPIWLKELLSILLKFKLEHGTLPEDRAKAKQQQLSIVLNEKLNTLLERLPHLSEIRSGLQDYQKLHSSTGSISIYQPLLNQLFKDILDEKKKLNDLKKVDASLGKMITSFSRFGFQRQARPTDHKTIILFVIGGITFEEINEIREIAKSSEHQIIIGSTTIATPEKMRELFFRS